MIPQDRANSRSFRIAFDSAVRQSYGNTGGPVTAEVERALDALDTKGLGRLRETFRQLVERARRGQRDADAVAREEYDRTPRVLMVVAPDTERSARVDDEGSGLDRILEVRRRDARGGHDGRRIIRQSADDSGEIGARGLEHPSADLEQAFRTISLDDPPPVTAAATSGLKARLTIWPPGPPAGKSTMPMVGFA